MMNFKKFMMVAGAEMLLPGIGGAIVNGIQTAKDVKTVVDEIKKYDVVEDVEEEVWRDKNGNVVDEDDVFEMVSDNVVEGMVI